MKQEPVRTDSNFHTANVCQRRNNAGENRKKRKPSRKAASSLLVLGACLSLAMVPSQPGNTVGKVAASEESSSSEPLPLEVRSAVVMLNLP